MLRLPLCPRHQKLPPIAASYLARGRDKEGGGEDAGTVAAISGRQTAPSRPATPSRWAVGRNQPLIGLCIISPKSRLFFRFPTRPGESRCPSNSDGAGPRVRAKGKLGWTRGADRCFLIWRSRNRPPAAQPSPLRWLTSPRGLQRMVEPIIPIIMCGGAGTRLWPDSREGRPKQFLRLVGERSTFQDTVRRVCDSEVFARAIVITNGQYRFQVAEQLAEIGIKADILLEPARRDSGPVIPVSYSWSDVGSWHAVWEL